ncbi:P-loop containing nucleoside triphosphate hydrolase protein, partial [Mycena epipterygia]
CCMATGDGKSALFAVPIIVLRETARDRHLYPDLPGRALLQGIVVTPTKGLAANIVLELGKLGIPAFAYCHESVTAARKAGRDLVLEIRECKTWNVICVDPEHLRNKAWREITACDIFRVNIVYGCIDEAHLINEWGLSFRPDFRHIGAFFNGRLPSSTSIMALSATLQPGVATKSLLHYLNSGRKAVIHCRTIDDVLRVFIYLWKALPAGRHRLRRIKMYHSLKTSEENEEILQLLDEDPECQVIIATIAFANGLNVKALLDSILLGFPETVDQLWQEKGRVGRNPDTAARGVVLSQPSVLAAAEKQLAGAFTFRYSLTHI